MYVLKTQCYISQNPLQLSVGACLEGLDTISETHIKLKLSSISRPLLSTIVTDGVWLWEQVGYSDPWRVLSNETTWDPMNLIVLASI